MSNAENDKLRDQFDDLLERIGVCPYCGEEVDLDPTDECCSEVHGEEGWAGPDGNFLEDDYEEHFQAWLAKQSEGTIDDKKRWASERSDDLARQLEDDKDHTD